MAWQRYDAAESVDFNELIHHIKTYYRLIFLDYAHMQGKQSLLDFACILFTKLQHLMQPACTSALAGTLRMFMPLSTLLEKFNVELKPAMGGCAQSADATAVHFITWSVTQLQQVRESANTVKRFAGDTPDYNIDYAMLHSKRKPQPHTPGDAKLQAAAAVSPGPPLHRDTGVQPGRGGQPKAARAAHFPGLKEVANSTEEAVVRPWVEDFCRNAAAPQDLRKALSLELQGGPTSVHGALARATTPLPPGVQATFVYCATMMLRMYYLYPFKQCYLCPSARQNPQAGLHQLSHCAAFLSAVPRDAREAFFVEEFNKQRALTPMPPQYTSPPARRRDGKRDRYDPIRKGTGNHPKRTRNDQPQQHVR